MEVLFQCVSVVLFPQNHNVVSVDDAKRSPKTASWNFSFEGILYLGETGTVRGFCFIVRDTLFDVWNDNKSQISSIDAQTSLLME